MRLGTMFSSHDAAGAGSCVQKRAQPLQPSSSFFVLCIPGLILRSIAHGSWTRETARLAHRVAQVAACTETRIARRVALETLRSETTRMMKGMFFRDDSPPSSSRRRQGDPPSRRPRSAAISTPCPHRLKVSIARRQRRMRQSRASASPASTHPARWNPPRSTLQRPSSASLSLADLARALCRSWASVSGAGGRAVDGLVAPAAAFAVFPSS